MEEGRERWEEEEGLGMWKRFISGGLKKDEDVAGRSWNLREDSERKRREDGTEWRMKRRGREECR